LNHWTDLNGSPVLWTTQQLAEADPAGWAIGWGAWPAGLRENAWPDAFFPPLPLSHTVGAVQVLLLLVSERSLI